MDEYKADQSPSTNEGDKPFAEDNLTAFSVAWANFENMVGKNYLDFLPQATAMPLTKDPGDFLGNVQMDRIKRLVYDKEESTLAKLNNVYSALALSGASVFVLIQNAGNGNKTELYLGTYDASQDNTAQETLENSIQGNFPGDVLEPVEQSGPKASTVDSIFESFRKNCLAVITGVPSLKEDTAEKFSQGLEKIIDALGDKEFSALFLSTPVDRQRLLAIESCYQRLYSDLSLFNISSLSLSASESLAIGKTLGKTLSKSLSSSLTIATTETVGSSHTDSASRTHNWGGAATGVAVAAGAIIGTAVAPGVGTAVGAAVGNAVGGILGAAIGSTTKSESDGSIRQEAKGRTEGKTETVTDTLSETKSETETSTQGKSIEYTVKNQAVATALKTIEEQLERIRIAKSYGAWNWAAYFTAPCIETVTSGAEVYSGILRGEKTGVEHCAVSYFVKNGDKDNNYENIINSIACFQHPVFNLNPNSRSEADQVLVAPTALLNTSEMVIGMALPQKSIPGLPVFESVEFGRSVVTYDKLDEDEEITIGKVSRFGSETGETVKLCINSLAAHTFITGSTGAGKSNAVYSLLHALGEKNIPFLVIEPAKGEYKYVFSKAKVFGTNPNLTELLRINPFSFPAEIHVTEHIDRLIEILNAVWPMYAAMPAILKEAVETTYMKCGWDLQSSKNAYDPVVFPDFFDLLDVLPGVIGESKYGEEVKSNYAGSLLTRVKSLTNGYYRSIFQKEELPPGVLFDENCIVDLSRVGSSETKSMLMGIIFLKLQEYRMAKSETANANLKHITVIEEAHNLLRRTNTEQGMETANLQGKAVEMISNAIAEMRTYGEGFIIADQAPGLLDKSVIRNTNTKIILRLPDYEDRLLVGKAENLSDAQIEELARLKTGCASVYQNNWQEAVLCQFALFEPDGNGNIPATNKPGFVQSDSRKRANEVFLALLLKGLTGANDLKCIFKMLEDGEKSLMHMYYPMYEIKLVDGQITEGDLLDYLDKLLVKSSLLRQDDIPQWGIENWTEATINRILSNDLIRNVDDWMKDVLRSATYKLLCYRSKDSDHIEFWRAEEEKTMRWRNW